MESHEGDVELLGVEDGVVRLRLKGSCDGCPASASTLELAIKEALEKAAPDLVGPRGRGRGRVGARRSRSGVELPVIQSSGWRPLERAIARRSASSPGLRVGGLEIVVANVSGSLLAFRDRCAACGEPIGEGRLKGGVLDCPSCERRYLPAPGRALDGRGAAAAGTGAAARVGRRGDRGGGGVSEVVSRLRGARRQRPRRRSPPRSAATSAAPASRRTPPPAPPRRAADPLRLRALRGDALGGRALPADRQQAPLARGLRALRGALGAPADPDRARLLHALELGRARRRRSTRAPPARPSASSSWRPGRTSARPTRCSSRSSEDVEALIVNRIAEPNQFAIAPIDECYRLVGAVKASWEGISGGDAVERVVPAFFEELRQRAAVA